MGRRGLHEHLESDGAVIAIRWMAFAFACVQTLTFYRPFPDGVEQVAWAVNLGYGFGIAILTGWWLRDRRVSPSVAVVRRRNLLGLLLDCALVVALTWVYAFDLDTAIFVVLYIAAIEGAFRYGLRGALATMGLLGTSYALRDVWAASAYDLPFEPSSVSFRVGCGLLIATFAGLMVERNRAEHARLQVALERERAAGTALRSLDDLRSTFLSAVSHELRTPLTSILGFSMTIQDRSAEMTDEVRMMLDQVVSESRHLEQLLEDLLDIERMGRGKVAIDRHQVDVCELARRLAARLALRADRVVTVDGDGATGVVDALKVERILDNLLGNAVKYSPDGAPVVVHVERSGDGVLMTVDDEGPGVPEALRRQIFAPFERGSLTSMHQPGTGIGLSLVDRFARLHGGRAWVEQRADSELGASFRVYLPDGPEGVAAVTVANEPWGSDSAD